MIFFYICIYTKNHDNNNQMALDYSEIRYYDDNDYDKIINRLSYEPNIARICRYLKNGISNEEVAEKLKTFESIRDFQINFILKVIKKVIEESIDELSSSGYENLDMNKKYLFITNHRNIVLDSSLLNHELFKYYKDVFQSTSIAIGNNLLGLPWVKDLARLNKCFVVIRDAGVQEMLEKTKTLSSYIRKQIKEDLSSVWIAQREGRTKDGNDITQSGLIKMFQMSGTKDFIENYSELNIVPVAISYEYDPCNKDKVRELAAIQNNGCYEKAPMEDFNSMYNGLMGYKGRVHFSFGNPISKEELNKIDSDLSKNDKIKKIGDFIDDFIHSSYKLWPNNYIAADMLNDRQLFIDKYNSAEKAQFIEYINGILNDLDGNEKQNREILLKIFANPVKNAYKKDSAYQFVF